MQPTSIPYIYPDTFAELVRLALRSLDDPAGLRANPLAAVLAPQAPDETTRGEQLRAILLETIEATRPTDKLPPSEPQWRTYHLLKLRYVQHQSRYTICETLAISQASYYRLRRQALESMAALLWQRAHRPPELEARILAGTDAATYEALRIAQCEPRQSVDVALVTRTAINTALPLLEQERIVLTLELPDQPLAASAHAGILHQAVLDILMSGIDMLHTKRVTLKLTSEDGKAEWRLTSSTASRRIDPPFDSERFAFGRELLGVYGGRVDLLEAGGESGVRFDIPLAGHRTILIIDDSEDTIRLYSRWLRAHDYAVRAAMNEQELKRELALQLPDVILLDVLMPHWDGWIALQDLKTREETRLIPVIISSVLSRPRLALALGAATVLLKPISEGQLIEAVRKAVDQEDSAEWHTTEGA